MSTKKHTKQQAGSLSVTCV